MKKTRQAAEKIGAMLAEDRTGRRLDPAARPAAADAERRSRDGSCCCLFTYAKESSRVHARESSTGRSNDGKEGARHVSVAAVAGGGGGGFRHSIDAATAHCTFAIASSSRTVRMVPTTAR